ncbi:MAG: prepilin-type N-terminal cleavage/methylation domain-containing protein [Rhodanobacteraceae bacterium]|nr:prepilin-type N-terminal cleavage/methylation domain-containing protein [Rhodanobacteraceae bacterium]
MSGALIESLGVGLGPGPPSRVSGRPAGSSGALPQPRPARRPPRQGGFTLLEVLVAFIVFVLIFGAVLDALGMAMRNTRRSAEVSEAALWAQSKLDAIGTIEELKEGSDSGEFNAHYRWQLDVSKQEVERTDGVSPDSFPVELYRVELVVSWGDRNRRSEQHFVTLRSMLKEGQF